MQQFRPGRFEVLPLVIKNIIIINVLVFIAQQTFTNSDLLNLEKMFALHTWQSSLFKPWQFLTYMFMHGSISHILFNLLALWMFGSTLENLWGPKRFLTFYIICGMGAALCHMIALFIGNQEFINDLAVLNNNFDAGHFVNFYKAHNLDLMNQDLAPFAQEWQQNPGNPSYMLDAKNFCNTILNNRLDEATLGASGAVFGCLAAFGYLFPNSEIILLPLPIPIKAKWLVLGYAAVEFFSAMQNVAGDNVAHIAHLGGALFGFALVYFWNKTNRRNFY